MRFDTACFETLFWCAILLTDSINPAGRASTTPVVGVNMVNPDFPTALLAFSRTAPTARGGGGRGRTRPPPLLGRQSPPPAGDGDGSGRWSADEGAARALDDGRRHLRAGRDQEQAGHRSLQHLCRDRPRLMLPFCGSVGTFDARLLADREPDDALGLTAMAAEVLADARTGVKGRHALVGMLRQSVFGRLTGHEKVYGARRLRHDQLRPLPPPSPA